MTENKLRVVVIDDNEERKKNIRDILPEYMEVIPTVYGNSAKEKIVPTASGIKCDLVIMNADDRRGQAIYMFDWMVKDEGGLGLDRIPVLLLVEDEFSDRVMSFLEIGDAEFYEGDINPDEFFLLVTSIINEAEFLPEPSESEPIYSEKSADRLYGMSFKPEGEDEDTVKRSVVYNDEDQLAHLDVALERGRRKQELIREIMEAAQTLKNEGLLEDEEPEIEDTDVEETVSAGINTQEQMSPYSRYTSNDPSLHNLDANKVSAMLDETLSQYEDPMQNGVYRIEKTIAVVDADIYNLNICDMYLRRRYNVVLLNSGMSAIDYFVKNKADLLLISYNMPVLDGVKILDSIRWQPNGKKVPTIFMADGNLELIKPRCRKEWVVGMLQKPLSQMALKQAVEAVFAGRS